MGKQSEDTKFASGKGQINLVSVHTMNKLLKEEMDKLEDEFKKREGVLMEIEDCDSDNYTKLAKRNIHGARRKYHKLNPTSKSKNFLIRTVRRLPLPSLLPSIEHRRLVLGEIDNARSYLKSSTLRREGYIDIVSYAFRREEPVFLSSPPDQDSWEPKFKLLATMDSNRTWRNTLEYSEDEFQKWWMDWRLLNPEGSKAWLDLRTLSRCIVFILDILTSEDMSLFPSLERLLSLANQARRAALELAILHGRHPHQDYGTSNLFGITAPVVYSLWRTVQKVKHFNADAPAIRSLACKALSLVFGELEGLLSNILDITSDFGAVLLANPHIPTIREETGQSGYVVKPTIADLLQLESVGLSEAAKTMILNSRLVRSESELDRSLNEIREIERSRAGEIIAANSPKKKVYTFDLGVLEEIGIKKLNVQSNMLSVLGSGSHSMVASYRSEDGPGVYAVKSYNSKSSIGGNIIRRECSIWSRLSHNNILPLLGYCILADDPFPSLVTHVCYGKSLQRFLKEHNVTDRKKLEFLRDISSAIDYMHLQDIAHGDLRAANILVHQTLDGRDARTLVCDFGISDVLTGERLYEQSSEQKTRDNWLAPELLFANRAVKARVSKEGDMYAYGCVILEVAFKRTPYGLYEPESVEDAKQRGELPATKADMDETYWPIARSCWEYDTVKRATSELVLSQLENLLGSEE